MPLLIGGGFHSKSHDTWPHSFFPLHRSVVRSLCRKTAPKHNGFHPRCFTVGMVFFGCKLSILSPPNTTSWVFTKNLYFGFIWPYDILQSLSGSSKCSLANFRRAWTCTGLSRWTRLALQDLSPWRRSVLLMVAFVTLVPALCRSFTRSPRVVLGFCSRFLWSILTPRGEILRGAQIEGDISGLVCFHFLIIAPTVDFLHTKLLTYWRFSLPAGAGLQFCLWCPLTALWSWP